MSELVIREKFRKLIEYSSSLDEISYKKFRNELVAKSKYRIIGFVNLFDNARNGNNIPYDLNLSSEDVKCIEALYNKHILTHGENERFIRETKLQAFKMQILDFKASVSAEKFTNTISQYPTMIQFYLTDIEDDDRSATWRGMFSIDDEKIYEELIETTIKNGRLPEREEAEEKNVTETENRNVQEVNISKKATFLAFLAFNKFIHELPEKVYNAIVEADTEKVADFIKDVVKKMRGGIFTLGEYDRYNKELAETLSEEEQKRLSEIFMKYYQNSKMKDNSECTLNQECPTNDATDDVTKIICKKGFSEGYKRTHLVFLPIDYHTKSRRSSSVIRKIFHKSSRSKANYDMDR